jgi:hypothetical protein
MLDCDPGLLRLREQSLGRLRLFWRWMTTVRIAPPEGTTEIDPFEIVAGGRALLPPFLQVFLWSWPLHPKPARWFRVIDGLRDGQPMQPIRLLRTRRGCVVLDGNHRVLAARQLGLQALAAELHEPEHDPGCILEDVVGLFVWENEQDHFGTGSSTTDVIGRAISRRLDGVCANTSARAKCRPPLHPTGFDPLPTVTCGSCAFIRPLDCGHSICELAIVQPSGVGWVRPTWTGCSGWKPRDSQPQP